MTHSVFSFSGSHRWFHNACPASIRKSRGKPNTTNDAAELGTAAHELREFCLKMGVSPHECLGQTYGKFVVDQNMADAVDIDVNYNKRLTLEYGVKPLLEQRVTMSSLGRTDVFGTADTTFIVPHKRILHSLDYKHGFGVVDVNDNTQLIGYAIATLDTFDCWEQVNTVKITIIQPRANHIDGPIRTVEYTVNEMWNWCNRYARSIQLAEDPSTPPVAGKHCTYCLAQATCRARMERTLNFAYHDHNDSDIPITMLEAMYREKRAIESHLQAIEDELNRQARNGQNFEGYKMVMSRPRARVDDEPGLRADARAAGVNLDRLYSTTLKSESSAKKVLPPELVAKYYVTPEPSPILVSMDDKRPAIRIDNKRDTSGIFEPVNKQRSAKGVFNSIK